MCRHGQWPSDLHISNRMKRANKFKYICYSRPNDGSLLYVILSALNKSFGGTKLMLKHQNMHKFYKQENDQGKNENVFPRTTQNCHIRAHNFVSFSRQRLNDERRLYIISHSILTMIEFQLVIICIFYCYWFSHSGCVCVIFELVFINMKINCVRRQTTALASAARFSFACPFWCFGCFQETNR